MKKMLGVMIDCSRNAVMSTQTIKQFANIIKKMGYNTIMLYTEDTYEVNNQPLFGHLRGRYSKEELKEIDGFCNSIGIELVPCIQTLAHLENMFKWPEYWDIVDSGNILLAEDEKTYALIEDMISTVSECFTSKKIHIGMDEAYKVGLGNYLQKHGFKDRFQIINDHLHRVCDITRKYGLEPMIWSDMFCKLALDIENQYEHTDNSKILEKANLPEDISLVYWDYYNTDYDHYTYMINTNKLFKRDVYFAGGAWTWAGFAPRNQYSIDTTAPAIKACKDTGIDDKIFITMWGDDGSECSKFTVLPALMYTAEALKGNTDMEDIKKKFNEITGLDFDSFMLLDDLDIKTGEHTDTSSKYLLYNDPFFGIKDFRCTQNEGEYYKNFAEKMHNVKGVGEFSYIFDAYEKLARVLEIKAELGVKTRSAYLSNNIEELKKIIKDYELLEERLNEFYYAYQNLWFTENKPHGFEIQDIRLGGVSRRLHSCKERLIQFVNGEIKEIPELLEPVLPVDNGGRCWERMVSVNAIFPNC